MIRLKRTDCDNPDFIKLVALLDADLAIRDGEDHSFYDQFNGITGIRQAVVAYSGEVPVGCGGIKEFDANAMEVKRMYVVPEARGQGLAGKVLQELELWTAELGYTYCILETGKRQPEAIALYNKHGYQVIPNYEPYTDMINSVCFKKSVSFTKNQYP
ncbi:GNAT family N-acetyltransferase [Ulvibacterium marinum]|uniref:N-acetyltransferase n=1 Tax=Ulvibacterium marinum TaxID=2419782 RepID=A0A3B0C7X4_9FLAO|nr:GNAT family N-acetyltransferase [Ulvibacterium marinum]RKN81520.1 N-acetyltransferase [Ulvibacterium marinum]